MSEFYQFVLDDIDGNPIDFDEYRGHVCLVVNLASL